MHAAPRQPGFRRVLDVARAYGWTVVAPQGGHATVKRQGQRDVLVEWSVNGAITYAFDGTASVSGRGKAERLAAYLRRHGAQA